MSLFDSLLERMDGRKYSRYFSASCPFHSDESPSLLVFDDGFHCQGCGAKGSLEYLDKKIGSRYIPKLTRYQSQSNVLPRWRSWGENLEEIADRTHKSLIHFKQFRGYFKKRKIEEFIEKGKFGYRDGYCVFPVLDTQRRVTDIVVRTTNPNVRNNRYVVLGSHVSGNSSLYSPDWDRVQKATLIYCVFGLLDSWSLEALELPCVTGITGQSISVEALRALNKRIIFLPDYGEERTAHKLANQIGFKAKVKALHFPDGCKDCDEVRRLYGNDTLSELIGV